MVSGTTAYIVPANPRINIMDDGDLLFWCKKLDCTKELLTYCVMKVGNSSMAVTDFLHMNKDRFDRFFGQIWEELRLN